MTHIVATSDSYPEENSIDDDGIIMNISASFHYRPRIKSLMKDWGNRHSRDVNYLEITSDTSIETDMNSPSTDQMILDHDSSAAENNEDSDFSEEDISGFLSDVNDMFFQSSEEYNGFKAQLDDEEESDLSEDSSLLNELKNLEVYQRKLFRELEDSNFNFIHKDMSKIDAAKEDQDQRRHGVVESENPSSAITFKPNILVTKDVDSMTGISKVLGSEEDSEFSIYTSSFLNELLNLERNERNLFRELEDPDINSMQKENLKFKRSKIIFVKMKNPLDEHHDERRHGVVVRSKIPPSTDVFKFKATGTKDDDGMAKISKFLDNEEDTLRRNRSPFNEQENLEEYERKTSKELEDSAINTIQKEISNIERLESDVISMEILSKEEHDQRKHRGLDQKAVCLPNPKSIIITTKGVDDINEPHANNNRSSTEILQDDSRHAYQESGPESYKTRGRLLSELSDLSDELNINGISIASPAPVLDPLILQAPESQRYKSLDLQITETKIQETSNEIEKKKSDPLGFRSLQSEISMIEESEANKKVEVLEIEKTFLQIEKHRLIESKIKEEIVDPKRIKPFGFQLSEKDISVIEQREAKRHKEMLEIKKSMHQIELNMMRLDDSMMTSSAMEERIVKVERQRPELVDFRISENQTNWIKDPEGERESEVLQIERRIRQIEEEMRNLSHTDKEANVDVAVDFTSNGKDTSDTTNELVDEMEMILSMQYDNRQLEKKKSESTTKIPSESLNEMQSDFLKATQEDEEEMLRQPHCKLLESENDIPKQKTTLIVSPVPVLDPLILQAPESQRYKSLDLQITETKIQETSNEIEKKKSDPLGFRSLQSEISMIEESEANKKVEVLEIEKTFLQIEKHPLIESKIKDEIVLESENGIPKQKTTHRIETTVMEEDDRKEKRSESPPSTDALKPKMIGTKDEVSLAEISTIINNPAESLDEIQSVSKAKEEEKEMLRQQHCMVLESENDIPKHKLTHRIGTIEMKEADSEEKRVLFWKNDCRKKQSSAELQVTILQAYAKLTTNEVNLNSNDIRDLESLKNGLMNVFFG